MKYKNRLVATVIVIFTFSVLYVITQEAGGMLETSREDSRAHRPVRRFGYLQDKIQEIMGIRKVVQRPDIIRLRDENDIRERIKSDKTDDSAIIKRTFQETAQKTESEQAFETELLRKFRRYDNNKEVVEVNGRTVMSDEKVDRSAKLNYMYILSVFLDL